MKRRRILSFIVALAMMFNIMAVPAYAAPPPPTQTDAFVNGLFDYTVNRAEIADLLDLYNGVSDQNKLITAYTVAFSSLGGSQQDRVTSFGMGATAVTNINAFINAGDNSTSFKNLVSYLRMDVATGKPGFKSAIAGKEAAIDLVLTAAGLSDADKVALAYSRMARVFSLMTAANGTNIFCIDYASGTGVMSIDSGFTSVVIAANDLLGNDIVNIDLLKAGLQKFVNYYNVSTTSDKKAVFTYLDGHKYLKLINQSSTPTPSPIPTPTAGPVAPGGGSAAPAAPIVTTTTISGNVGIDNAVLSYMDGTPKTVATGGDGNYSFIVSKGWTGTVTIKHAKYTFEPASFTFTNVQEDKITQDFKASIVVDPNLTPEGAVKFNATQKIAAIKALKLVSTTKITYGHAITNTEFSAMLIKYLKLKDSKALAKLGVVISSNKTKTITREQLTVALGNILKSTAKVTKKAIPYTVDGKTTIKTIKNNNIQLALESGALAGYLKSGRYYLKGNVSGMDLAVILYNLGFDTKTKTLLKK